MINLHLKVDEEIELKIPNKEDALSVFALVECNREWLGKYMEWEPTTKTSKDVLAFFNRNKHMSYYDPGFPLIIWYKKRIVGIISFNRGNALSKTVEIGYWIAQKFSGRGIITKSTQSLINFAFAYTDIKTILIQCEITNIKSYQIPIRLGFEFIKEEEGTCYLKNGVSVKLTYQMKKKNWEKNNNKNEK